MIWCSLLEMPFLKAYFCLERERHYLVLSEELGTFYKTPVHQRQQFGIVLETVVSASDAFECRYYTFTSVSPLLFAIIASFLKFVEGSNLLTEFSFVGHIAAVEKLDEIRPLQAIKRYQVPE